MKIAWLLIILGVLLIAEGGSRIVIGLINGNIGVAVGGVLTGILLGGYLLYRGVRRKLLLGRLSEKVEQRRN